MEPENITQPKLDLGLPKILTVEEQLVEALTKVAALYEQLKDESAAPVLGDLDEDDAMLVFHVELHTKHKMEYRIKSTITLPQLLSTSMLKESFRNYTNTVYNAVIRPMENKFNALVNARLEGNETNKPEATALGILSPPSNFGDKN